MRRQQFALMISMLCRIGVGLASILVLAHGLNHSDYGFVVTVLAWSAIAALLTDFGFGVQALRDIGANPERAGIIMTECLRVKLILSGLVTFFAGFLLLLLDVSGSLLLASLMLYISLMATSFGDLLSVALRGIGRYDIEAWASLSGATFFVIVITLTAILNPGLLSLSASVLLGRLGQLVVLGISMNRYVRLSPLIGKSDRNLLRFVVHSSPLALDTVLTVLTQQVDVILVGSLLGLEAAASYQVVSRTAMYFLLPAQVLAGVYIPRLAADVRGGRRCSIKMEMDMQREFAIVGGFMALTFLVIPVLIGKILPPDFLVSPEIVVALAGFIFLRFSASASGSILVARKRIDYRLIGQFFGFGVLIFAMPFGLLTIGLTAAPLALAASSFVTFFSYVWFWRRLLSQNPTQWKE